MFENIINHVELDNEINRIAARLGCELDSGMTYREQAEFLADEADQPRNHDDASRLREMSRALFAAEECWFELEDLSAYG